MIQNRIEFRFKDITFTQESFPFDIDNNNGNKSGFKGCYSKQNEVN